MYYSHSYLLVGVSPGIRSRFVFTVSPKNTDAFKASHFKYPFLSQLTKTMWPKSST